MARRLKQQQTVQTGSRTAAPSRAKRRLTLPIDERRQRLAKIDETELLAAVETVKQLPATLPGRVPITRLLVSLHVSAEYQYPAVAMAVRGVFARVPWLAHLFDINTGPIQRGLEVLASSGREKWPDFSEPAGIEPLRALYWGRSGSDPALDPLLAILIAGAAQSFQDRLSTPQWKEIRTLSLAIHRVAKREDKSLRNELAVVRPHQSRREVVAKLDAIWASGRDHLSLDWRAVWKPWLGKVVTAVAPVPDPSKGGGTRVRVRFTTKPGGGPKPIEIPVVDVDLGDDSEAEVSTSFLFDQPRIRPYGDTKATRASKSVSALGSFYQRNSDLLCDHIEVLTESELRQLLKIVEEDLRGLGSASNAAALDALATRLGLESTLDPETLLGVSVIGEAVSASRLMLDLGTGDLVFSVLDPGIRQCPPGAEDLFEQNADYARQPLSDGTVAALRKIFAANPNALCLRDCAEAPSIESVYKYLESAADRAGLDPSRCTFPRLLRVAAVRIQEFAADRAATMLTTKDASGISTAPLHYFSPRQSSLDHFYRNAIWTLFPRSDSDVERESTTRTLRVGPARMVRQGLAKAAIQALSNRLNTSVARDDGKQCITLHNRFCTYVMHYFLIISSHRVEKALFTVTRRAFDLANFVCFIEDKKVDPAHWPRPVAITARFARQLWLYLDHLRELRNCPWEGAGCLAEAP